MAKLAPFLKAPSGGGVSPASAVGGERPRTGLSNYLRRLGALIFDFLFLFLLMRVSAWAFFDQLAAHPVLADTAATWFVVLYFFLGASPASKGQTIGKMLVAIRVTDYEGNTPGYAQAFLRTMLLYPGIWLVLLLNSFVFTDDGSYYQFALGSSIGALLNFTLFIACSFAIVFNPFKQGHHDFFAKTLVRYKKAPNLSFDELASLMGDGWKKLHLQPQMMAGGTFVILVALLVWQIVNNETGEYVEQEFRLKHDILAGSNIENARLEKAFVPNAEDFLDTELRKEFIADINDAESTQTIKLILNVMKDGRFDQDIEELEGTAENIANFYHAGALVKLPAEAINPKPDGTPSITNLKKRPLVIEVKFTQHLPLYYPSFQLTELGGYTFPFPPIEEPVGYPSERSETEREAEMIGEQINE